MDSVARNQAIHALVADYCHFVDELDCPSVARLFAPEGVLHIANLSCRGRDAITTDFGAYLDRLPNRPLHLAHNTRIFDHDDRIGGVTRFFTFFPAAGLVPARSGHWEDEFVFDDRAYFLSRRVVFDEWSPAPVEGSR
ncbi:MAG: nuclear transport factor 2 family protein [Ilumatobacteraceae bacterium]